MRNKLPLTYTGILISMFIWSFSFVWIKIAYESFRPITVVLFRLIISAALLWGIGWSIRRIKIIPKKHFKHILLLSFFEPFLYFLSESYGLSMVSSTTGAVIISTVPVFVLLVAHFVYSEKLNRLNIAGVLISFMGVILIVLNKNLIFVASPLGVGLMFIAVFSATAYTILLKKLSESYSPLTIIAYQNFYSIFAFLPLFLWIDYKHLIHTKISNESIIALLNLAILASSLAFIFFTYGLKRLGVSKASIFTNLIPVITAVYAFIRLNETFDTVKMSGIFITVVGLFVSQIKLKKRIVIHDY